MVCKSPSGIHHVRMRALLFLSLLQLIVTELGIFHESDDSSGAVIIKTQSTMKTRFVVFEVIVASEHY